MRDLVPIDPGPTLDQWMLWGRVLRRLSGAGRYLLVWPERARIVEIVGPNVTRERDAVAKQVVVALWRRGLVEPACADRQFAAYRLSEEGRSVVAAGTGVIARLEREVEKLREVNAILSEELAATRDLEFGQADEGPLLPEAFDRSLTPHERQVALAIVAANGATVEHESLYRKVYGERGRTAPKIIDVFVCKVRKKLKAHWPDATIGTDWGRGYFFRTGPDPCETAPPPSPPSPPAEAREAVPPVAIARPASGDGPLPPAPARAFDGLSRVPTGMLKRLIAAAPAPVSPDMLGPSANPMIAKLRRHLAEQWPAVAIETVRGHGYRICVALDPEAADTSA